MNATQQALWDRWTGFLAKIGERQREIFAEAEAGLAEVMEAYPEDPLPYGNALTGIRFRVDELRVKVQDTWDKQVEPKFSAADDGGFLDRGIDARVDAEQLLSEGWTSFEARMNAEFYRHLHPRMLRALEKEIVCVACGATLEPPARDRAVSINCPYCHAVNQVLPETAVALYQGAGHAFGEEAALPLRHAVERFRIQVDRQRRAASWASESVESLDRWEAMERAAWMKYAEVRGQALGLPPDLELVESRMANFRKYSLMTNQSWRRAKGL